MNKKFKLFSTIASLCLAVALMAFGVWAANTATFKVTGNVTFTAAANVVGEYKAVVSQKNKADAGETIAATNSIDSLSWNIASGKEALTSTGVSFNNVSVDTKGDYYIYTFTFKSLTPGNKLKVTVTDSTTVPETKDASNTTNVWTKEAAEIKVGEETKTLTENAYSGLAYGETFSYSFKVKINTISVASVDAVAVSVSLQVDYVTE